MKKRIIIATIFVLIAGLLISGDYKEEIKKYVAIGDSLTAGYQSGGLVENFQKFSFPNIIATQLGITDFEQPLISYPGIPPIYVLGVEDGEFTITQLSGMGEPKNLTLERPYDNLGIPGATLYTALYPDYTSTTNPFYQIVLRNMGNAIEQAIALQPDLITFWLGNNEILYAATHGIVIEGQTVFPPEDYAQLLSYALGLLKSETSAKIIVFNIPDITAIPFVNYIKPYIEVNGRKVYLIGPEGTMTDEWKVLLSAMGYIKLGYGIPAEYGGNGLPLPDEVTLSPTEITKLKNYVKTYNETIEKTVNNYQMTLFDVNTYFNNLSENGVYVGGVHLTTEFITGGLFSLDGVHPSSISYAILANEIIKLINETFDYNIPLYSLKDLLENGNSATPPSTTRPSITLKSIYKH